MTTERRKAALDAILERIHREGQKPYGGFSKKAALWIAERCDSGTDEDEFVDAFRTGTDFHRYNSVSDRESFLRAVYRDAFEAASAVPPAGPERLFVEDIDSFSRAAQISSEAVEVGMLNEISEADIKRYLREIIGEPFDQQDWGGELNDLFTDLVKVNGRRVDTAFMLKGPSVSSPLQISNLGRRGDQVQRLFQSPADLFVIQYNGKIEDRTKQHIDATARDSNAPMYCIINGTDTLRLLMAYNKL